MLDLERNPELRLGFAQSGSLSDRRQPAQRDVCVPGLGARVVKRILTARRHVTLRIDDLARLVRSLDAVRPFFSHAGLEPRPTLHQLRFTCGSVCKWRPKPA